MECSICQNTTDGTFHTLDCGHSFHIECIMPWFRTQGTCPMCRDEGDGIDKLAGLRLPERAETVMRIGRQRDAPPVLKDLLQKYDRARNVVRAARKDHKRHLREHRLVLAAEKKMRRHVARCAAEVRKLRDVLGMYDCDELKLPPVLVFQCGTRDIGY